MAGTQLAQKQDVGGTLAQRSLDNLTRKDIKEFICPDATEKEASVFIRYCVAMGLDPFAKQIHLVKFKGQPAFIVVDVYEYIKPATLLKYYDGFRAGLILQRDGQINEIEGEFYDTNKDKLLGAWCRCYRKDADNLPTIRFALELWNKNQALWKSNPAHMIYKTAVKHAFKQSFPGTYSNLPEDDFPIDENEEITVTDTFATEHNPETGEVPDPDQIKKLETDKRRTQFFKYMNQKHGLSNAQDIRERISQVIKKPVEHLSDFFTNDEDFLTWAEADKFTMDFDKNVGELFGDT